MEGRWLELADPRLEGRVIESEVMRLVKVALCCLHGEITDENEHDSSRGNAGGNHGSTGAKG